MMTADEVACYRHHLSQATAVLEYGVGGSTALAAEVGVPSLYSIDSDPQWIAKVSADPAVARMIAAGRAKLVHADIGPTRRLGKPKGIAHVLRWTRYARRPWRDGFRPDLVLVDGRFRLSCILEALKQGVPKIAVHDFTARRHLQRALPLVVVIEQVDSLAVLQPRRLGWRGTMLGWRYRYDSR